MEDGAGTLSARFALWTVLEGCRGRGGGGGVSVSPSVSVGVSDGGEAVFARGTTGGVATAVGASSLWVGGRGRFGLDGAVLMDVGSGGGPCGSWSSDLTTTGCSDGRGTAAALIVFFVENLPLASRLCFRSPGGR